jgi:serine protease Do
MQPLNHGKNLVNLEVTAPTRHSRKVPIALILAFIAGVGGALAVLQVSIPANAKTSLISSQNLTPMTFTQLAKKVTPAVVAIQVHGRAGPGDDLKNVIPREGPFGEFFEHFFDNPENIERFNRRGDSDKKGSKPRSRPRMSQGSGFIISDDGFVVTNHHVVKDGGSIIVLTEDGEKYKAKLIGADERTDLAILKIETDNSLPYVNFTEHEAEVGEWVMAVGNPFGLGGTVTTGIVSARGRVIGSSLYDDYIQIDAAVNRGNSGGPTFNLEGEVIGVNTAIYSPNGGNVGIGFAIPASLADRIIDQLIENGEITRGWLGVSIQTVTPEIAESVGLDAPSGTIISDIFINSPAEIAAIKLGDVVLEVNGHEVHSPRDLARTVAEFTPGDTAKLLIHRDRQSQTINIEIGEQPENPRYSGLKQSRKVKPELKHLVALGIKVEMASQSEEDPKARGVIITEVKRDSEAGAKGIVRGDKILRVAGIEVNSPKDLDQALQEARNDGLSSVLALVRSRKGQQFITFKIIKT